MLSLLFGLCIFLGGIAATLFVDSFWGVCAGSLFVHITPMQLHIESLRAVFILSILTMISYAFGRKYSHKFSYKPAELWLMLIMLLGMILSITNAFDKQAVWDCVFAFFKMLFFYLLLVNILDSRKKISFFINGMLVSAAWLVYRCWDLRGTTGARFENEGGGIIQDSNQFAAALLMLLPLAICTALKKDEPRWMRLSAATGAFGIIMSIIIAASRGAFLGLIASALFFLFYFKEQRKRAIIMMAILAVAVAPFIPQYYIDRITSIFISQNIEDGASADSRLMSWKLAYELWEDHPFVGIGMNNFGYYMGYINEGKPWGERGHVTHSIWLQALSEGGLAVFLPFISIIFHFFKSTKKIKKTNSKSGNKNGYKRIAGWSNRLFSSCDLCKSATL